jgi:hypothetical protein
VVVAAILTFAAGASPASAVSSGDLGIRPATESDFFHLTLTPGASTTATAVVSNRGASPVTLLDYPVDAHTTTQGTFAMGARTETTRGVGRWARLPGSTVTVPAASQVSIPFRLSVPRGTPPGDYAGAIIIQAPPVTGRTATLRGGTAVRLDVVERQGVRIYLTVAGSGRRAQKVGPLSWHRNGRVITLSQTVRNTGTVTLHPANRVSLTGWPSLDVHARAIGPQELLPGASFTFHARVPAASPVSDATGTSVIRSEAGSRRTTIDVVSLPWLVVLGAFVALTLIAVAAWRFLRFIRRARRAIAAIDAGEGR